MTHVELLTETGVPDSEEVAVLGRRHGLAVGRAQVEGFRMDALKQDLGAVEGDGHLDRVVDDGGRVKPLI